MIVVGSSRGRRCIVVAALSSLHCRRCIVVAALSSLRAITFVSTPLRSVPTHIHRPYSVDVPIILSAAVAGDCDCCQQREAAPALRKYCYKSSGIRSKGVYLRKTSIE
jgi:Fe-S-cluster-containing hydrogenase component 2